MANKLFTRARAALLAGLALASAACTIQQADVPGLTGPSEFATSIEISVTPDVITQNGTQQATVTVTVRDDQGRAKSGASLRVDMAVGGVIQDYGTLSLRNVVTGSDGRAIVTYTAPPAPPANLGGSGTVMTIFATLVGSNFSSMTKGAQLLLVPPGIILPPAETPTARFTFSPTAPFANTPVVFDASTSCAGAPPCLSTEGITSFVWNYGDGDTDTGRTATHSFPRAGTFTVTLTVTNNRGLSASTTQTVQVGASSAPTATIVVSPADITVGDDVFFTVTNLTPGNGRTIVSLTWNFGDGSPAATGQNVTHQFAAANTYTVLLTIVDDIGQTTTVSRSVQVDP